MDIFKVVLTGGCGQMGKQLIKTFLNEPDIKLVGVVDRSHVGDDPGIVAGRGETGLKVSSDLKDVINRVNPDMLIDFTHPGAACENIEIALSSSIPCIVGTTGLGEEEKEGFHRKAVEKDVTILIAPNFSIGAVLMMRFASMAAPYFASAEIIELHHNRKKDAPSGTALMTAKEMLKKFSPEPPLVEETEILKGARGGVIDGIRIHSVRLPGLLAHQEVLLGGGQEILKLRHDATGRECFMPGVVMAIKKLKTLPKGLVFGLDKLLEF